MADWIERFGASAVMGRPVLSYGEINRMTAVQNIITLVRVWSGLKPESVGKWIIENPVGYSRLEEARKLAENDC